MRHLANFRVRVFLFTVLVAVAATAVTAATAATAWLTVQDVSSQITESVTAERETVEALSTELSRYAAQHGTWEGVAGLVADLSTRSGQRLRMTTLAGEVVVDSEHLAGREARPRGDIAHELRTPLANLRGYLEALSDGVLSPSSELFVSLHEEAVLQQRVVDDLQELALAEAGALRYRNAAVDVADLLESCQVAHHAVPEAHDVVLRVETAGELTVRGDSDRLRQAITNLVSNALNATPPDGSVTLRGRRVADRVLVEVLDTGHGIAPADQVKVFDRFWRADAARGRRTGGSGLGLAITREFVTAHGGTITVASEPGAGTVFTISLPTAPTT